MKSAVKEPVQKTHINVICKLPLVTNDEQLVNEQSFFSQIKKHIQN